MRTIKLLGACAAAFTLLAAGGRESGAQSQSGFTYNGLNFTSYQASEYLNSGTAATSMRATGASHTAVMVTQYQQTATSNVIAPETTSSPGYNYNYPLSPTDAAVVSAIQSVQAQGLIASLKPQVDSLDGVFRGNFAPSNPAAWFASYQTFLLHYAQIAAQNNVGILVIGTEFKSLSGPAYKSYWQNMISQLRAQYPNLTLAYAANATGAGDEYSSVSFWADVDIIGVDGYFPLTSQNDPPLSALVSAWTSNGNGFNIVAALHNLQSTYNKPLIFTEIGYVSVSGTNKQPYASLSGPYDGTEQRDCYEAFFEVFSQQSAWMKGVFWWDWTVSAPGSNDTGYSAQNKPAGMVTLPKWFDSTTPGFTIAPSTSTLATAQGLSTSVVVAVTRQGGFSGAVTLAASGLPSGLSAVFSAGAAPGTQLLTLTAGSAAAIAAAAPVTITGTSGLLSASTLVAVSVTAPNAQTITFNNPGTQQVGTPLGLSATASSGLPVTFASGTASICSVDSATATASFVAAGTCTITATQPGNNTYAAAPQVTVSFTVNGLAPVAVPASATVIVSQTNWRAGIGGNTFAAGNPAGSSMAVNSRGFVVEANSNNVVLFNAQSGAVITLGAWSSASALAVDRSDNIYVGNSYGPVNVIAKIPYVGGPANGGYASFTAPTASTPACTPGGVTECVLPPNVGSVNPGSMAFDASGNLFYATAGDGSTGGNSIYRCSVACQGGTGAPLLIYTEPKASPAPSASSGQLLVGSMAFDTAGNLFFTDSSIYVNPSNFGITSFFSNLNELAVTTGSGFGGSTTGYAPSPHVLYTVTPATIGAFDNQLDGVAVSRGAGADTVYFADQNDGIFAFPDSAGGVPVVNGRPTALYAVSPQGAKTLALDAQNNLYLVSYSNVFGGGGDTLAQVTVGSVSAPASSVGVAVSPSATLVPVSTLLNASSCTATPAASVSFVAGSSASATASASTSGSCSGTLSGGAAFATAVSFTPIVAGPDAISLTATDQAGNTGAVTVNGVGAGFVLSSSAASLALVQGSTAAATITVMAQGGYSGGVNLAATGLPSGVTASFAANPATGATVLTLTATATASVGGPVTITVTGTAGTLSASTTLALTVVAPPSFALSSSSSAVSILQGGSTASTITIAAANGFASSVTLAASGLPSGVTASFATNPATTASVLTLSASPTATAGGPVSVTVTGTSGTLTSSTTIAVSVAAAPGFTLAAAAGSLSLTQGTSSTDAISVTPVNGFTGGVTLTVTGLPAGVTAAFSPNPAVSGTSVLTLTASASATSGPAVTLTITGTSGSLSQSTTVALTVNVAPGFTLTSAPAAVTLIQGASASSTVTIAGKGGFTGAVTLAAAGLPSGVSATFAAGAAQGTQVVSFAASGAAGIAGPVIVTLTGTSGPLSASTTLSISVSGVPGFTLAGPAITVVRGATSGNSSNLSITPANGFVGTIALTCSISPVAVNNPATCSLAPSSLSFAGPAAQISTLTIGTTAATGGALQMKASPWYTGGGLAVATLLYLCLPRRRRAFPALAALLLALAVAAGGCGGSSTPSPVPGNPGTTPGSYVVTVTGVSGATSSSGTVVLNVQ